LRYFARKSSTNFIDLGGRQRLAAQAIVHAGDRVAVGQEFVGARRRWPWSSIVTALVMVGRALVG
jgi:hypothetical protein